MKGGEGVLMERDKNAEISGITPLAEISLSYRKLGPLDGTFTLKILPKRAAES